MSQILLPAVRRPAANLFKYTCGGGRYSGTSNFNVYASAPGGSESFVLISETGLKTGDMVSGSAEIRNLTAGDQVGLHLSIRDSGGGELASANSSLVDSASFVRASVEGLVIPSGAIYDIRLGLVRGSGTGTLEARKGMINVGPSAEAFDIPKRGAWAPILEPSSFARENLQSITRTLAGVAQVTSFPRRLWQLRLALPVLSERELREWSFALEQLSDLANCFRFTPPLYDGPSTGYEGANPVVAGAGQTGTSLDCDGVDIDADIVGPGDYLSFDAPSPLGTTQPQLFRVNSLATSDGSGNVTIELLTPIRISPADNAVVQIYSPTAQFALTKPMVEHSIPYERLASLVYDSEEMIYP